MLACTSGGLPEVSPYNYFQERYRAEPWRLLCCVIMLNLTTGRQLEGVDVELFRRWPTARDMAAADQKEVADVVRSLGLYNRRSRQLIRMSVVYAFLWDGRDPLILPGIGKYGADSYRIFILGQLDIPVEDKELRRYLEWRKKYHTTQCLTRCHCTAT
jgi:methyl-CpG-binding domain protein 4